MDPLTGFSLAGAAISPIANAISGAQNYKNQRKLMWLQSDLNQQAAEWQNQTNIANWQMQNEYNTPANQMQRLIDAGLNPNLMYGNGSAATGNADNVQGASAGSTGLGHSAININTADAAVAMSNIVRNMQQGELMQSQIDMQRAQQRQADAQTASIMASTRRTDVGTMQDLFNYNFSKDTRDFAITKMLSETDKISSETKLNEVNYNNLVTQGQLLQEKLKLAPMQSVLLSKQIQKIAADIVNVYKDVELKNIDTWFQKETFTDRVETVSAVLADCLQRTANNKLQFDENQFKFNIERLTGVRPGATPWDAITSLLNGGLTQLWRLFGGFELLHDSSEH